MDIQTLKIMKSKEVVNEFIENLKGNSNSTDDFMSKDLLELIIKDNFNHIWNDIVGMKKQLILAEILNIVIKELKYLKENNLEFFIGGEGRSLTLTMETEEPFIMSIHIFDNSVRLSIPGNYGNITGQVGLYYDFKKLAWHFLDYLSLHGENIYKIRERYEKNMETT